MFEQTNVVQMVLPVQFVAIDIETGNAPKEAIEQAIDDWKPPKNWKPETVETKRAEMAEKKTDKAALLDASPILCICARTDLGMNVFNGMNAEQYAVTNSMVFACGDEKQMLIAFKAWADMAIKPDTIIVGHNIRDFDLPKIRQAYIRHRLKPPVFLMPSFRGESTCEVVDTMTLIKAFSMQHRNKPMLSLEDVANTLCIQTPKALISGADVPVFHENGRYHEILIYCAVDTETTAQAFLLMSGMSKDLT